MNGADFDESKISQESALDVLKNLGYKYLEPKIMKELRGNFYNVLLKPILKEKLNEINSYTYKGKKYKFSEKNIDNAIDDLNEALTDGLILTNEKIYDSLMLGRSYTETLEDGNKRSFTIRFIDWDIKKDRFNNKNDFYVTKEFVVEREDGTTNARVDIVTFINGIPFGTIECKKPSVDTEQAVSQTIRNQSKDYIPHLFKFIQITMATNTNKVIYATVGTPKKFWSIWKEENKRWLTYNLKNVITDRQPTNQDRNIISLFHQDRVMEIMKYFTIFDKNTKKICRYQQYFCVKKILKTINETDEDGNRQGGIIWHTQGSGKSLTMVMLSKYIFDYLKELKPRIVVVTDRIDLDKQINQTFNHTRLKAVKAATGQNLINLIKNSDVDIITTVINKFEAAAKSGEKEESKNIFVLVDEAHRSQYNLLNIKMKKVFPNACYLGFTGTPLLKNDKTVQRFGGKLIDEYTIKQAVDDKAIVPLLYEGRMVKQSVNKEAIDTRLNIITRNLNDKCRKQVEKKWETFEKIASSDQRIQLIAFDIDEHFIKNYKLKGMNFKAMVATNRKKDAIRYLKAFEDLGDLKVAVVISAPDEREGCEEVNEEPDDIVIKFWKKMMDKYNGPSDYEETLKSEFIDGNLDILIVVDKLLTGFDAPCAAVLYVDKVMKEHTLLQAVARVNRLYENKEYGYIIDYRGLITELDEAMEMYSGAGLEGFDGKKIKGVLKDITSVIADIKQYYSDLADFFSNIKNKDDVEEYMLSLEKESRRKEFYELLSKFSGKLSIVLSSEKIYDVVEKENLIEEYKKKFKFYQNLREAAKHRYSDTISIKDYETKMQNLIDNYIPAEGMIKITDPVDIMDKEGFDKELSMIKGDRSKADTIRTRLKKSIYVKYDENPAYYKKFSDRIEEILEEYKKKRLSEAADHEYLTKIEDLLNKYRENKDEFVYPECIDNNDNAKAFYGVVNGIISESDADYNISSDDIGKISLDIDNVIKENTKIDWHDNVDVHNKIAQEIDDILYDYTNENNVNIPFDDIDKIIEQTKSVALKRY